ncbi:two-component regulator propeller domain-containing protein [Mariniflexile sp. HMF6888]|uniref:two-component regulator propeller domain-containing protein n=1 Tax=Mariniflexile sp. HMF6888 TaxID=3373086 RepID=UPI00379DB1E0
MLRTLLIFFFIAIQTFGQQIKFKNFTTNEGLSNNSVIDIENDKDGGLWIATWDGLNYFDGYNFKVYKHNINNPKTISSNYIIKLEKDINDFIWLISKEGHVNRYIGNGNFESFKFKSAPKDIKVSRKGNIIVETNNIYYEYLDGVFEEILYETSKIEDYEVLKQIILAKHPNLIINDVLKDKLGNIWFATRRHGLYIIPNNTENLNNSDIDHYAHDLYAPYSFKSNEIEKLHQDDFGNIWLGQKDGGLSMAYSGSEKIFSVTPHPIKYPNLPNETIRAITKDNNGKIWLGYYNKGLYFYDSGTRCFQKFKVKEVTSNSDWGRIRTLFTASDGTIWAGTYAGILRIHGDKYVCYEANKIKELPNNRNYSIYEDEDNQIWIACWGGLAKFNLDKERFEIFAGQNVLTNYHIRCVKKIRELLVLATEENGVLILNLVNGTIERVTTTNGILGNSIYSVCIDDVSNNYWIASLGGVSVFNTESKVIKNITEADGLPSHMVYGLLQNGDKVWISTTKGIAAIDKENFTVTTFNPNEGWQAPEFSEGAYYQDAKGVLFFGGVNGLNYFNPNNIQLNHPKAKIKLLVDGNENYSQVIKKSFRNNQLNLEVVPIIFPRKHKKDIYYKLEERDKDWCLLDGTNKIKYTNLVSGNYNFLVKEGENGMAKPALFSLHIKKAFYETALFYALLSVFILVVSILFIFFKNKVALSQQQNLEAEITYRTRVIESQKIELQKVNEKLDKKNNKILKQKEKLLLLHNNLKNEDFEIEKFKTFVLSEFQEPISQIIKTSSTLTKDDAEAQRNLIYQSGKLVNLMEQWNYLDHIKHMGPMKISVINLFPMLKTGINKLKKSLQVNKVNFSFEIGNSLGWVETDVLRLRLLIQYFFNDISKYSEGGSTLNIKITDELNFLVVQVVSNSSILNSNWHNISHYSPYFKAVKSLLQDLKGELIDDISNERFQVSLHIPIFAINPKVKLSERISWKHFNPEIDLSSEQQHILVFSDETNHVVANQVLGNNNEYNLIFESTVSNLNAAINQINIKLIVFYQTIFSKELVGFFNSNRESKNIIIPMVYISEDINYELHEQSLEFGIDTLIQLPASTSFINKKIGSLIDRKQHVVLEENKFQKKLFQILTEKDPITTPDDKLLKTSLEIIKKELHNPSFNVEMLVEELGVSRVKCYRLFKEAFKQSPSDIIMSLRLQKAEVLLKTKKLNISEISFECGYNDPKYFARSFKKHFGKPPKEFKEQIF